MTIRFQAANEYESTLAAGINNLQTTLEVVSAVGRPATPFKLSIGTEILDVIGVVGNVFTVIRGREGTVAVSHTMGAAVENRWTAGTLRTLWDAAVGTFVVTTSNYTLLSSDSGVGVAADASTAPITITLPTAVGIAGRMYTIKKTDASANEVIVASFSTERIDGELTQTIIYQHTSITIVSDGVGWNII